MFSGSRERVHWERICQISPSMDHCMYSGIPSVFTMLEKNFFKTFARELLFVRTSSFLNKFSF